MTCDVRSALFASHIHQGLRLRSRGRKCHFQICYHTFKCLWWVPTVAATHQNGDNPERRQTRSKRRHMKSKTSTTIGQTSSIFVKTYNGDSHLYYYRSAVHKNLSSKFDRFLAECSQFDTVHDIDFYSPIFCLSATFVRPLFAFVLCFLRQKIINNFAFRHEQMRFLDAIFILLL